MCELIFVMCELIIICEYHHTNYDRNNRQKEKNDSIEILDIFAVKVRKTNASYQKRMRTGTENLTYSRNLARHEKDNKWQSKLSKILSIC